MYEPPYTPATHIEYSVYNVNGAMVDKQAHAAGFLLKTNIHR